MTDWTPKEDEAFNEVEKHSNLGKQILREIGQPYHFEKREWVGLTAQEIAIIAENIFGKAHHDDITFAMEIQIKLKEKNTWK